MYGWRVTRNGSLKRSENDLKIATSIIIVVRTRILNRV